MKGSETSISGEILSTRGTCAGTLPLCHKNELCNLLSKIDKSLHIGSQHRTYEHVKLKQDELSRYFDSVTT